jgi:hypothetical protein
MLRYKFLFKLSPTMSLGQNSVGLTITSTFFSQRHLSSLLRLRSRTTRCDSFNCRGRLLKWYHLHRSHLSFWDQLEKSSGTTSHSSSLSKIYQNFSESQQDNMVLLLLDRSPESWCSPADDRMHINQIDSQSYSFPTQNLKR